MQIIIQVFPTLLSDRHEKILTRVEIKNSGTPLPNYKNYLLQFTQIKNYSQNPMNTKETPI